METKGVEFIWHGRRFWVQSPTVGQHTGWNTRFEPCWILKRTAKRVKILSPSFGAMFLNRETLERDGRVYHSKVHEYFYAELPAVDSENKYRQGYSKVYSEAFAVLGLKPGCSKKEIIRAYKKLSRTHHPDTGGSHDDFIKLNSAYKTAIGEIYG